MKTCKALLLSMLTLLSLMMCGQRYDPFLDTYHHNKNFLNQPAVNATEYQDIEGSPYLNSDFLDGIIYFKDTSAIKLPLRYNIYANEMEYQLNGVSYLVGNPQSLNKIILGESVFLYLPFIQNGGYFELLESGKCFLVQKRCVKFKPAEGPKPIEGTISPAKFSREPDIFFIIVNDSKTTELKNMKSVMSALQDQEVNIDNFIKKEKIRSTKKENLIKIANYYNSL